MTFQKLAWPVAPTWSNFSLSRDGTVMAANYGGEIFRWTQADGFVDLGMGDFLNSSVGISADGTTIVTGHVGPDGYTNPAIWQKSTGWVDLGYPAGGCLMDNNWGDSWGVSGHGRIVVGLSWYCPGAEAFKWTQADGMVGLGHPHHASSRATTISADGSTIVGFYEDPTQGFRRPVRWIAGSTDLFLGDVPGEATAVSSDGSQIVGQAADSTGNGRAFYYSNSTGLVSLGILGTSPYSQSVANGVSDNGLVIGASINSFTWMTRPFLWTAKTGIQPLKAALVARGAVILREIALTDVLAISLDGSTIVGLAQDNKGNFGVWMARKPCKKDVLK